MTSVWGRLANKQNAVLTEGGQKPRPIFSRLWTKVHRNLRQGMGLFAVSNVIPIVYILFHFEDIRR